MLFANITSGQAAVSTHVAVLLAAHVTSRESIGKRKDSHHTPAMTGSFDISVDKVGDLYADRPHRLLGGKRHLVEAG
jgi:hypothetical protein